MKLVGNGKEPRFKDRVFKIKPDIVSVVKTKVKKETVTHRAFLEIYIVTSPSDEGNFRN